MTSGRIAGRSPTTAAELAGSAALRARCSCRDPERFARLSFTWDDWLSDVSKERLPARRCAARRARARGGLLELDRRAVPARKSTSPSSAALHTALRQQDDAPLASTAATSSPTFAPRRRGCGRSVARSRRVARRRDGPADARRREHRDRRLRSRAAARVRRARPPPSRRRGRHAGSQFVSNVDPEHLTRALAPLDPATTLFIVTSKTFTTRRRSPTRPARRPGSPPPSVRARTQRALRRRHRQRRGRAGAFGIAQEDVLPMSDWVGGRYSLWSAVGLRSRSSSAGNASRSCWPARRASTSTSATPLERNLPVLLGLARLVERGAAPAHRARRRALRAGTGRLPAYLQQLVLESNGKRVARDGVRLRGRRRGAVGRVRHQRPARVLPVAAPGNARGAGRIIVPVRAAHPLANQQTLLVANALAQAQALLEAAAPTRSARTREGLAGAELDAAVAARVCPGNRASTTILMPELDAHRLGQLLALYEHRTFVEAVLCGINPFDQFGVELGKTLAAPLVAALADGTPLPEDDRRVDAGARRRTCAAHCEAVSARCAGRRRARRGGAGCERGAAAPVGPDRLRELPHRRRVEPAPVVAREHVEVVARDPVARALGVVAVPRASAAPTGSGARSRRRRQR